MRFVLALLAAALLGASAAGTAAYVALDDRVEVVEQRMEQPVRTVPSPAAPAEDLTGTSLEVDSELLQIMNERLAKLEYRVQLICDSEEIQRLVFENNEAVGVETCE